jgi:hypothetical protein
LLTRCGTLDYLADTLPEARVIWTGVDSEHARIVAPVSDPVEQRDAIIPAGDRLAIDDARA